MSQATPRGPQVTDQRNISEKALSAFRSLCAEQSWVFAETNQKDDYGKDGYLDLSNSGELDGLCVAIQIKGGTSLRRSDGYVIKPEVKHRRIWHGSTVPVFGIIWDPDGGLFWVDLSGTLKREGEQARLHAPHSNILDEEGIQRFEVAVIEASLSSGSAAG